MTRLLDSLARFALNPRPAGSRAIHAGRFLCAAVFVSVLGCAAPARAAESGDAVRQREVRELMALSGIDAQLTLVADAARAQVEQRRAQLPAELGEWMLRTVAEVFAAGPMRVGIEEELFEQYDASNAAAALAWLRSPLGREISRREVESSRPEMQPRIAAYDEELNAHPPSEMRMEHIGRMIRASEALEASVEAIVLLTLPVITAFNSMSAPESRAGPEAIEQTLDQLRERLRVPLANQIVLRGLFTYAGIGDEDIERYASFLESEAGKYLYAGYNLGLLAAMHQAGEEIAKRLSERDGPATPRAGA